MTPEAFRAALSALGLTMRRFAALTGVRHETMSRWGHTLPQAPAWVPLLLDAWVTTGVPSLPSR